MELLVLRPALLWLLPLALAVWFFPHRAHDRRLAALRSGLIALLVFALAEPALIGRDSREHHVFVLDASASVAPADRVRARECIDVLRAQDSDSARTTLIVLGDVSGVEDAEFDEVVRLDGDSPLPAALRAAARAIPPEGSGSVSLFTDGLATDHRWGAALEALSARDIPVHTVALGSALDEPRPVGIEPLGTWRVGHTARALVRIAGRDDAFRVTLRGPDGVLAEREGEVRNGRALVTLEFEPAAAGFLETRVELGAHVFARTFAVQDPLRVLYLGRSGDAAKRLAPLVGRGFQFEVRTEPPPRFDGCDLVWVDDLPARAFADTRQTDLVRQVTDEGVGLLVSGGEASFGPGGYRDTPVESLLPVDFVQKEEKRDPSTTLVLIIDTSGSMGGMRVQLAKEVARLAIRRLLPHDKVGIVEFYGAKRWAAPIQPASNAIEIQRALNRLDAGGGTVILPAIEEAYYGLQNVQTRYKHVLVLTDGGVEQGAFEPLLRKMAHKGMNVSAVLIGAQAHSEFLVSMANWGKGRFYSVPNRFNLPEVILKQPTTARLPAYRRGKHALRGRGGAGWWGSTDPRGVPDLAGYVETRARDGAEVLIETVKGAHPVLASWRYGLGRVTALMTEPAGPGTGTWRDWEGYGALLAHTLARTAHGRIEPFAYTLERDDHLLRLTAHRRSGNARPQAVLLDRAGKPTGTIAFHERADGLFEAAWLCAPDQEARVLAGRTRLVSGAHGDRSPELLVDPSEALDPMRVARETGGETRDLSSTAPLPTGGGKGVIALRALWPFLLLLALLLFLFEIAYRRWPRKS